MNPKQKAMKVDRGHNLNLYGLLECFYGLVPDGLFDSMLDDILLDIDWSFHLL